MILIQAFIYQNQARSCLDFDDFKKAKITISNAYEIQLQCVISRLPSIQLILDKLNKIE